MIYWVRRQGKRVIRFPCCSTGLASLNDVAVAVAAMGRDDDCRDAFDVSVMSDGKAAIDGLGYSHQVVQVAKLFK